MTVIPTIDLSRIREHAGSQHRAFEELAYLVAWDLEGLEQGTELERRAAPDGGVEFSCVPTGGNGGRWAWQAKYLFRFDASTFRQMKESFLSAVDNTPDLERYIFVLPKDRTTTGLQKWRKAVAEWSQEAQERGMSVDLKFHGESDLLRALTQERHAGAIRYFFDHQFLTRGFFESQVKRAVEDLGARYDPRANVETEARRVIDAACRGPRFVSELMALLGSIVDKRPHRYGGASLEQLVTEGIETVDRLLNDWRSCVVPLLDALKEPGSEVFRELAQVTNGLKSGVDAQSNLVDDRIDTLNEEIRTAARRLKRSSTTQATSTRRKTSAQRKQEERERRSKALDDFRSDLYRIGRAIDEVLWYLQGDEVMAAIGGSVMVVGEAGCGKSHLVADLATERVGADMPSVLVLGQVLTTGPLDRQIVSLLDLGSMTLSDFLQAVDAAARVRRNGRTLLIVDALNEGPGADLWKDQLRGFVAKVAKYDWVALVLTLRDVYEPAIAPDGAGEVVRAVHQGLFGHEEEALALYADLYELRLPDVPALLPELSNPLFLRSMCQSVHGQGLTQIPREAANLVWVFDGLIEAVEKTLRRPSRLDYPDWETKVRRAVHEIASAMVDEGSERLSLDQASEICLSIHDEQRYSRSLLNGLIVEGLLLRERVDGDGQLGEGVRFTYQRLSDHLRADVLVERYATDRELAAAIRGIATGPRPWAMSGLIEALVLLVPERRGKELSTVLRLGTTVATDRVFPSGDPSAWLRQEVQSALFTTLMWRSPASFTSATRELLKRYLEAGVVETYEWLRIVTGLACVPDHPLNMTWLDSILSRMSLPERDEVWSRDLLWLYSDGVNPIERTIDWAWSDPDAPEDATWLTALFLSWLFTSPNRRLRDTATKALVSVTSGHTQLVAKLVDHFAPVNDPYVLERVLAAAYGHVLRVHRLDQGAEEIDALEHLAQAIFSASFGAEPTLHLMMRHRARSALRIIDGLVRAAGRHLDLALARIDPPYDSPWPPKASSGRQLAKRYGREYNGYLGSATELDWDFEDKVLKPVTEDLVLPNQGRLRAARRRQLHRDRDAVLDALIDAAPPSRKTRVARRAESLMQNADPWNNRQEWDAFGGSLSKTAREQAERLRQLLSSLNRLPTQTFHPPHDLCARWVAARVLDLGWTQERFGERDRWLERSHGEHTTERIAKKYERIAFQELCGLLTDHCLIDEGFREAPVAYEGPWQVSGAIDLDPSLLLRGDEPESDTPAARLRVIRQRVESEETWWRTHAQHEPSTHGTDDDWLSDISDIPHPVSLVQVHDTQGREWVAVERHQQWSLEDRRDLGSGYRPPRRLTWFRSQANIIRADDTEHREWAATKNWMGLNALSTPQDVWRACIGEYPDVEPWPSLLDLGDSERRPYDPDDDPGFDALPLGWEFAHADDGARLPYSIATVGHHQDSGKDFAATDTPGAILPSRILLTLLNAHWAPGASAADALGLGPVEREYCWVADDEVIAFCAAGREYGSGRALWVRAYPLRAALAEAGLAMWSWTLGEKIYWSRHEPSANRTDTFGAVGFGPGPVVTWGYTIERDHDRGRGAHGRRKRIHVE